MKIRTMFDTRSAAALALLAVLAVLAACGGGTQEPGAPAATSPAMTAAAPDVSLAPVPPMGFNTWNKFGCNVDENLIRETADAMVETGMLDAGY
jgi:alpha-galactosidase